MIKRIAKSFWDLMVELGEARHQRIKANNYHMWY
jgi:hypothetical protein